MTLALALRCSDGLVLATDSRATGGPLGAADISEKFLQVNRDVGVMTYGLATPGYRTMRALVEMARSRPGRYVTMQSIVEKLVVIGAKQYGQFVKRNPDLQDEVVGFILAGYDGNETGLFKIHHMSSRDGFAPVEEGEIIAAQWHLPSILKPHLAFPGMSVRQGMNLAVMLIVLTASFNKTVGGPIHLAKVTIDGGFSLVSDEQVQDLVTSNQPRFATLRAAWAAGWLAARDG